MVEYITFDQMVGMNLSWDGKFGIIGGIAITNKGYCLVVERVPELDNEPASKNCPNCKGVDLVKKCFDKIEVPQPINQILEKPTKIRFIANDKNDYIVEIENPNPSKAAESAKFVQDFNKALHRNTNQ